MSVIIQAKEQIAVKLSAAIGGGFVVGPQDIVVPPDPAMGDLAFGCFAAAKALKASPAAIAKEAAGKFAAGGFVASAEAAGPYINFRLNQAEFSAAVIAEIHALKENYGQAEKPAGEKVMIEYAQPNTHKEFHVGHLRNVCLGQAVVNLSRAAGFGVVPVAYMGDIGAHVAKCLWCLKKFHDGEKIPENKGKYLGRIYAEATRRVDEDEELKEEVAAVQRKLEGRDPEWDALWKETREWSLEEFRGIFKELGVELDRWYLESEVEQPGKDLVKDLLRRGIATEGEKGALIVDLEEYGLGVFLVLKSDGNSLYSTKELALADLKFREYKDIDRSIHVVDSRQSLYFRQFFKTLELMGFKKALKHLAYEFVTLKEGAMSSRQGNIVSYEDFRDEVVARVSAETKKRRAEWDEARVREAAWTVAEGAMKFGMLKQDPDKPIVFDLEEALSFDGFTGPYVQYAHARLASILAKAGETARQRDSETARIDDEGDQAVVPKLAMFPEIVAAAAEQYKPSLLAQYLFELGQAVSDYYRDTPVIGVGEPLRSHRLAVVEAARQTLENGLALLGIKAPREM